MRHLTRLTAILALLALLAPPMAWGCGASEKLNCAMSDCPMSKPADTPMSGCHSGQEDSRACDVRANAWLGCCDTTVGQEPVEATLSSQPDLRGAPLVVEVGVLESHAPAPPAIAAARVLQSQLHSLGRFTLLSSYLL